MIKRTKTSRVCERQRLPQHDKHHLDLLLARQYLRHYASLPAWYHDILEQVQVLQVQDKRLTCVIMTMAAATGGQLGP